MFGRADQLVFTAFGCTLGLSAFPGIAPVGLPQSIRLPGYSNSRGHLWRYPSDRAAMECDGAPPAAPAQTPSTMNPAARSATMIVGAFVLPDTIVGNTDASATRKPSRPWTRQVASTTAMPPVPIAQVLVGW